MSRTRIILSLFVMLGCLGIAPAAQAQSAITIVSPIDGSTIDGVAPVTFEARVGPSAVTAVEYYVGNTLACTGFLPPDFACVASVPWTAGVNTITAQAYNTPVSIPPITITVVPPVPFYRLYNAAIFDHFYTTSATEADLVVAQLGYTRENACCRILPSGVTGGVPLYRLYNATAYDHLYTASPTESDDAVAQLGYTVESIAGYIYPTQQPGTVPLYRAYQPSQRDHFYTIHQAELNNVVAQLGYTFEGITGYVYPP